MLDQHWQFARLRHPVCLVSRTGKEMINMARSLVEWMGGSSVLEEDDTGTATLKLRSVFLH
jgi:cleavage and polyadenylation specificity factor subunit 2